MRRGCPRFFVALVGDLPVHDDVAIAARPSLATPVSLRHVVHDLVSRHVEVELLQVIYEHVGSEARVLPVEITTNSPSSCALNAATASSYSAENSATNSGACNSVRNSSSLLQAMIRLMPCSWPEAASSSRTPDSTQARFRTQFAVISGVGLFRV